MISLLIAIIVAILVVIVLFIALNYFAAALGGDVRLWLVLKGVIVILALLLVLQHAGIV